MITRNFNLYLNAGHSVPLVINVNQYDSGEQWVFTLYNADGTQYTPSTGAIVGIKSDGLGIINSGSVVDGKVVINETEQMTAAVGKAVFELLIDSQTHGTANFIVLVEEKPGNNADLSESDLSLLQEAIDATSPLPTGGTVGQVLTKTANGSAWSNAGTPTQEQVASAVSDWADENITVTTGVVIDTSLSVAGAAADAKTVGDEISILNSALPSKMSLPSANDYGTSGQYPRSTGSGIEWTDYGLPSDEQTAQAVTDWLDAHPEATTTVEDGSLTYEKLVTGTLGFVTPEMFGAKGDGVTDDTNAFTLALATGKFILCDLNKQYLVATGHEGEENYPFIITEKNVTIIGHFIDGRLPENQTCIGTGLFHLKGADGFTFIGSIKSNSTLDVGSTDEHYTGLQSYGAAGVSIEGDVKNVNIDMYGERLYSAVYNGCWGARGDATVKRFNGNTGLSHSNIKVRTYKVSYPFASNNCENNNINIDAEDTHRAIYLVGGRNNYINIKAKNYYNVVSSAILLSPSSTVDDNENRINLSCSNNVVNFIDTGTTVAPRGHGVVTFGSFGMGVQYLGSNSFSVSNNVVTLNGHITNGSQSEMGLIYDVRGSVAQEIAALQSHDNVVINNLKIDRHWDTRIQPYATNYKLKLIDNVGGAVLQVANTNSANEIAIEGKILSLNIVNDGFAGKLILSPSNNNPDIGASYEVTTPIYINGNLSNSALINSSATRNQNIKKFSYFSITTVDRTQ